MAYHHDGFSYAMEHQPHASVYFHHPAQYSACMHQPTPELMYQPYPFSDYVDFLPPGMGSEDYDDSSEVSTRPRLTKDQVEVLETQFQAHPKPNSMVKKQLAMQTKLTLPRVANWFQNRRAKAKQQKKQEEYEIQQSVGVGMKAAWKSESNLMARRRSMSEHSNKTASPGRYQHAALNTDTKYEALEIQSLTTHSDAAKEASWQSLQRALDAAKAAQQQRNQDNGQDPVAMMPPELGHQATTTAHSQVQVKPSQNQAMPPPMDWSGEQESVSNWTSASPDPHHSGFDFGFDHGVSTSQQDGISQEGNASNTQSYVISPEDWHSSYSAETPQAHQSDYGSMVSPPLPLPVYPSSRRGSGAEELTNNFGQFALQGTAPVAIESGNQPSALRTTDGEIDLASRRKRPRPAALTSASLRSRSYGALSSTSPAFRPGPLSGGQLRHVKSTGHSLNSQYAGIRKSSLPQRSPLNLGTFAEAEAFKKLMAQQAAAAASKPTQAISAPTDIHTPCTAQDMGAMRFNESVSSTLQAPSEILSQYKQLQSPPVTPFQPDFMMQSSGMGMQPPVSAPAQFATFAEYTPPYSAGPLTNSTCSWSDAPLHSPEVSGFPGGNFMSSLGYGQQDSAFQQWVLPSDNMTDPGMGTNISDDRKTEFYITEFPGQKEEHANVALKIPQQKPKNYVFANTAPCDYDS